MSVRVMTLVWALDLPDSQKIVLLALADSANDDGHCWPSMASLASKCSKSARTIQGVIKDLIAAGHLTRREVVGKGCDYFVHPRSDSTPAADAPRSGCAPAEDAPDPRSDCGPPPQRLRTNRHRTTIKGLADAKPKRAQRAVSEFAVPDWMPVSEWAAFLEMRRQKGAWPTDGAVALMVGKLERWRAMGHDPGAILDASTENNWTGLFEPKAPRDDRQPSRHDEIRDPIVAVVAERQAARAAAERREPGGWPEDRCGTA